MHVHELYLSSYHNVKKQLYKPPSTGPQAHKAHIRSNPCHRPGQLINSFAKRSQGQSSSLIPVYTSCRLRISDNTFEKLYSLMMICKMQF